jgi:hypothetical protein
VARTKILDHCDPERAIALTVLSETLAHVQPSRGVSYMNVGAHRVDHPREVGEQGIQQDPANTRPSITHA